MFFVSSGYYSLRTCEAGLGIRLCSTLVGFGCLFSKWRDSFGAYTTEVPPGKRMDLMQLLGDQKSLRGAPVLETLATCQDILIQSLQATAMA